MVSGGNGKHGRTARARTLVGENGTVTIRHQWRTEHIVLAMQPKQVRVFLMPHCYTVQVSTRVGYLADLFIFSL